MASITGTNAFFCNQLVNVAGITAGIVANKKVPIQNTTIMNFTAVSNYTVCYSATVKVALTYSDPSSVTVWDMGGFPYVNATSSTQIIASNPNIMSNVTTIAQCQAALNKSYADLCALFATGSSTVTSCTGMGVCCTGNNCNSVIYFSSASSLAISVVLLFLSLVASVSVGL